ncbi:MAG: hypothetical protein HYY52_05930, partial [Candidatus Melainabacteria bacterium]|nr:hypothetical protein [Candidatus Melainabacteria bacterium]
KQKNSLIPTLERSEITNNFQNNFKSPETIVNYPEHIYGSHEIKRTVISGEPFELGLKTCFSDDVSLSDSRNVSANFEINSHKVEVSKDSSDFKDITNNIDDLISGYINRCIDIQSYGVQYKKLNCTDSSADTYHCKDACTILDGHICNVNIFSTGKELNKYQSYSSLFNPAKDILDITKGWDVGHYDLRLTINENQDSCFTYGTCLGKNPNEQITSETYTYSIDVIREPNISYPDSQNLKLLYDKDNEITFKFIAKDNLPFNLSSNRVPEVGTPVWSSIEEDFTPEEITILSKSIDPNDPRNYIVELKTNIHPKSLNKLNLKIPVIFPSDYFNSEGIQKEASFTFNILANLQAEIVSPSLGTLLGGNKTLLVTSKVKKPEDLTNEFPDFNNCAKSTINFQIETVNKEVKTLEIISPKGKAEKIESKGVDEPGGRIFKNNLNFNLKNIFRKDFLSGNIFGPIKLYGEYSTFCNTKNITFDGDPKTYILLDNPRIIKGNCKYPSGANYSKCEFTISNNTLLDVANGLQLEVIPNLGTIDPACSATFPQVTFEKENKLTKKVKVDCLPKEATSIEIKLKRNPGFLNEIEKKLTGTGLTTANNQEAIVADRKSFEVKNAPQEEENTLLKVGDSNDKSVTVDGKEISVGNLNKLLFDLGYLANENEQGYTTNTRDAFARLICDYRAQETNLSNIRFLTLYGSCQENDYSNFKTKEEEVKIATVIQDFMRGILISNTELYHAIKTNPVLATFVIGFAVTAGVVITVGSAGTDAYIAGVLAQLGAVGVMTQIEDIKNKLAGYFNESNSFKAGYVFGEAGKLVGLAVVIGFASKGLTNLSYTIQGVKQAQILSEQGYKDLANAIYEQVSKINNAADDLKIGMKKGLDGVLKTVDDIQTGEIFKDFQRLWPEVTQEEISSIKLSALKLFNDIVAKMQQQEELFKIYETDPGGYETKVLEHALIDKRFQSILQSPGKDLAETVKNAISEKVNGTVSSLNQYFANKGLLLIGDVISQDTVPPRLSTFMKISDFKKYNLKGTKYEDAKDEVIIADIKSGVLNPSIIKGELSTRSGIRWWTDTSKIDELRTSGILTKEYITGDNGVALDYNPLDSLETHIEIIISKENIDFYVPVSSAGGRKFVPSPNNPDLHNGKSLGGLYEIYSNKVPADITSGHVTGIDVVE